MDAFFASVEQAANPNLKNKPIIVGSRNNKYRTVVAACSYEAKAFGVESGMSAKEAFRLCPQAIFVPADCAKYLYTAQKIFSLLQNFSPQVEMASIDEFYLDITGCEPIFGSREKIAHLIKQNIYQHFGITCSIGIAPNKLTAKVASKMKKPDGLIIWEQKDISDIFKDMPVEKICGIGPKISSFLHRMSIFTCSQLAHTPKCLLVKRFGKYGLWLLKAARGEDSSSIDLSTQPKLPPKSVGHSYTLEKNINKMELIKVWIRLLCETIAVRLRKLNLEGSVVHLYLRKPDMQWRSKQKKFSTPTFDGQCIYQRSLIILRNLLPKPVFIRALGVSVSSLVPANFINLFEQDQKRKDLLFALDQINDHFGEKTIYPAHLAVINTTN
jgi:DNA polymerase-4